MIPSLPDKALRMLVDIARLAKIKRILGEGLLITSLPGKALRMLVDIARLVFYLSSIVTYCFSLQSSSNDVIFDSCV